MNSVEEIVLPLIESTQSDIGSFTLRPHSTRVFVSVNPDLKRRLKSSITPPHTQPMRVRPSGPCRDSSSQRFTHDISYVANYTNTLTAVF